MFRTVVSGIRHCWAQGNEKLNNKVGRVLRYSFNTQSNGTKTLRDWNKNCPPTHKIVDMHGKEIFTYDGLKLPGILVPRDHRKLVRSLLFNMIELDCENQDFDLSLDSISVSRGVARISPTNVIPGSRFDFSKFETLMKELFPLGLPWELNDMIKRLLSNRDIDSALTHVATHSSIERNIDRLYLFSRIGEPDDSNMRVYNSTLDNYWPVKEDTYQNVVQLVTAERNKGSNALDHLMWTHNLGVFTPPQISAYLASTNVAPTTLQRMHRPSEFLRFSRHVIVHHLPQQLHKMKSGSTEMELHEEVDKVLSLAWRQYLVFANNFATAFEKQTCPAFATPSSSGHVPWTHVNRALRENLILGMCKV